jgi:hypothetical protein
MSTPLPFARFCETETKINPRLKRPEHFTQMALAESDRRHKRGLFILRLACCVLILLSLVVLAFVAGVSQDLTVLTVVEKLLATMAGTASIATLIGGVGCLALAA